MGIDADCGGSAGEETEKASQPSSSQTARSVSSKGLVVLVNGVVSMMRDLALASRVPSKTRDPESDKRFGASPTWGKAFRAFTSSFFSLVVTSGKASPVEKNRDAKLPRYLPVSGPVLSQR
jgi:hypothetical protein